MKLPTIEREDPKIMITPRVIPCLLLKGEGLYKGVKFTDFKYVGDPINAVKIFNDKEVDELVFLDITATSENRKPNIDRIEQFADECYMPFAFGGGIKSKDDIKKVLNAGAEKVVINTAAVENPQLIQESSRIFGNQSIVVAIDVKSNLFGGYNVYTNSGSKKQSLNPVKWAEEVEKLGAGEIILTSINCEGTGRGYDLELTRQVSKAVNIPVVANGGASTCDDFCKAVREGGASAVAAGSLFVFYGKHRAVLIQYPAKEIIGQLEF